MHVVILVPPDAVVGSRNSVLLPFLRSLHCSCDRMFQQLDCQCSHFGLLTLYCAADNLMSASCLFWLAWADWLSVLATAILNRLLCLHEICLLFKYFPSINFPASFLSMKPAPHVWWCVMQRLMDASFFPLSLIHTFSNPFSSIHVPCPMIEPLPYSGDPSRVIDYNNSSSLFTKLFPGSCHTISVLPHLLFC